MWLGSKICFILSYCNVDVVHFKMAPFAMLPEVWLVFILNL